MAQWKRAGPITQRSEDQNLALLDFFLFSFFFLFVFLMCQVYFKDKGQSSPLVELLVLDNMFCASQTKTR